MTIYCVYLTTYRGNKLPPFYIGSTSTNRIINEYHGSVRSKEFRKIWESEIKNNPHLFKTKIISTHMTRKEAIEKEFRLHKQLNVVKSSMYINKSLATVNGFFGMSASKESHWGYNKCRPEETRLKISKNHIDVSGKNNPNSTHIIIKSPTGMIIKCFGDFKKQCKLNNLPYGTMLDSLHYKRPVKRGVCVGWEVSHISV